MASTSTFGQKVVRFLEDLHPETRLPRGVSLLDPYQQPEVMDTVRKYYQRYYADRRPRVFLWGINPGRLGAGITGIPFTDPVALTRVAKIPNDFSQKPEASAMFVHEVMEAFGGIKAFTRSFFLTSVCPLGFVKGGKNYNYYDDPLLQKRMTPFIIRSIERQMAFGVRSDVAICLGEGKNYQVLQALNQEHGWFGQLVGLPHPRFVMQYRRTSKTEYILRYVDLLNELEKAPRTRLPASHP